MKTRVGRRQRRVNAGARGLRGSARSAVGAPPWGRRSTKGNPVLDVLYAAVVIAVFAVLLLVVRGLDRL